MTGTNAELIEGARQRRLPIASAVGIEDVAYDGGWGSLLAASAADVPLLLDALDAAEGERDAALAATPAPSAGNLFLAQELHKARSALETATFSAKEYEWMWGQASDACVQVEAERDAALALIADVRELGQAMESHPRSHQYGVDVRYALIGEATK